MSLPVDFRIRAMIESDLDAILALERGSETAPHWERAEYLALTREIDDSGGSPLRRFGLVAERGGAVAGFAALRLLLVPEGGEAELESILVAPQWRGRGIGGALLAAALLEAKRLGAVRLDLEVRASSLQALSLYERAGFREIGRRRGYYRAPDEDAVLMSATL
jgi:ribosomal-protein-alanine N-acetyltransferase